MQIQSRNGNGALDPIYGTISSVATKDKFLECRNGLNLAFIEDYGMLKSSGGKKHGYVSGIKMVIQDNSGKNEVSNLSAIIPEYMFEIFAEVCKQNLCSPKDTKALMKGTKFGVQNAILKNLQVLNASIVSLLAGSVKATAALVKNQQRSADDTLKAYGGALRTAAEAFKNAEAADADNPYVNYEYSQTRVNIHSKKPDGYCSTTTCTIKREQYRSDGSLSKSPWSIAITTFEAMPKEQANGTFFPDMKTVRDSKTLFINISDEQMWAQVYAVQHFIRVWEDTYCVPLVREGVKAFEQQAASYRNR